MKFVSDIAVNLQTKTSDQIFETSRAPTLLNAAYLFAPTFLRLAAARACALKGDATCINPTAHQCPCYRDAIRFRPYRVPPYTGCFLNELWESESKLDECILYAYFELDISHRMKNHFLTIHEQITF